MAAMATKKLRPSVVEKSLTLDEQQEKINEVKKMIGPIADKLPVLFTDASISRYLRARNWNTKKACRMLKETLKWRQEYKPEKIQWDDVAREAANGRIYRSNYLDKYGRTVLVMKPGLQNQNSTSTEAQIKYLVYCMENAIMNLPPGQEQMVWLIDFQGWNMSSISVKVTRETAHVLQDHYPERLGRAILFNPPKIFESFWSIVKPFLESKTSKKVKFVHSNDPESRKIMGDLFDMEVLDSAFGGQNTSGFDFKQYSQRMKEEDKKMEDFLKSGCSTNISNEQPSPVLVFQQSDLLTETSDGASTCSDDGRSSNVEGTDGSVDGKEESLHRSKVNSPEAISEPQEDVTQVSESPA